MNEQTNVILIIADPPPPAPPPSFSSSEFYYRLCHWLLSNNVANNDIFKRLPLRTVSSDQAHIEEQCLLAVLFQIVSLTLSRFICHSNLIRKLAGGHKKICSTYVSTTKYGEQVKQVDGRSKCRSSL